ncbi:hypothetical protein C1I63_04020 [Rathayibacter caricis DSM 15933]|uniref:Uncharacterized protein n=1 Tax=Rathayibacter caricis DSM 15933 TaxID=1328867 RepID=A0A2T4URD3_9MICO|nr:hypothetical protein [Rathayibacter caricis]PTL72088.1 hypothetical protein C1I63_04020 [Rathayibacter caricis DSM 15933]
MKARIVVLGAVVAGMLAGCTGGPSSGAETGAGTSASASASASVAPLTRLDCDSLLPVERASEALGLPADRLEGSRDGAVRTSSELIRAAAEENGGLLTCSWFEQDGPASIVASAATDAGDAFAALPAGPALAAGDAASGACLEGSCTAQVLAGSTWVSLALIGAPATLDLAALASSTADSANGRLDDVIAGTAPVCADLLTAEQLTSLAGLAQPVAGAGTEAATPATAGAAASARAGLASCTWTDAASAAYSGLSIDALPSGEEGWRTLSLTTGLSIPLAPVDGLGERAISGCSAGTCEVDVLAEDVWWRVVVTGDEARADAVARAVLAG